MTRALLLLRSLAVLVWMASLVAPLSTAVDAKAAAVFSAYGIRLGDLKIGVVLLDLNGSPNPSRVSHVQDMLEKQDRSPYSVQQYFEKATHGAIQFDFDVFGPYSVGTAWCDHTSIVDAGNVALAHDGANPYQYDAMIYATEEAPEGGCRYQGGTYQGSYRKETNTIVLYGYLHPSLIVHELGHALGLEHAHTYDCYIPRMPAESCATQEHGDPTDLMGQAVMAKMYYNFNAPHKIAMGRISANEVKDIKRSGTYTLIGSENTNDGTHVLKIKADALVFGANASIFIEYRQPLPEFSKSMASIIVVTLWTENIDEPTYYLGSLNCHRAYCDTLALKQGAQTIHITALYEGTGKAKVSIDINDATIAGG